MIYPKLHKKVLIEGPGLETDYLGRSERFAFAYLYHTPLDINEPYKWMVEGRLDGVPYVLRLHEVTDWHFLPK